MNKKYDYLKEVAHRLAGQDTYCEKWLTVSQASWLKRALRDVGIEGRSTYQYAGWYEEKNFGLYQYRNGKHKLVYYGTDDVIAKIKDDEKYQQGLQMYKEMLERKESRELLNQVQKFYNLRDEDIK